MQCIIDQYSKFEVIPGVFVNGKLTQGENIADCGGTKNAFFSVSQQLGKKINQPSIVQVCILIFSISNKFQVFSFFFPSNAIVEFYSRTIILCLLCTNMVCQGN